MKELDTQQMQELGRAIELRLPKRHGFIVLAFPFGDSGKRRLRYLSNAERKDVILALKEFLIKAGKEEDWMQHIK